MKTGRMKVTAPQLKVLVLMAQGLPPKAIAARLGVTPSSVCGMRQRLFARNGIRNDTQLGMLMERQQVLTGALQ
jgi:DNA-binding NarL/FixJ family response regulator